MPKTPRRTDPTGTSATVTSCATPWCIALAQTDGAYCPVHAERPKLCLMVGTPLDGLADPECRECGGSGECGQCQGHGEHECDCGDEHECHRCDSTGLCQTCDAQFAEQAVSAADVAYLRWAFGMDDWRPFDAEAAWLGLQ